MCEDSRRKWLKSAWFMDAATLTINRKESACIRFLVIAIRGVEVRRRRQRWIKFVNQTRKHWTPGKTSSICSVHFKHEDPTRPFNSNLKRVLREDEFGVCVWPTIHVGKRASKNEHKSSPTKRQKRMASKLLLDLLLSPWICHVFYQIMSKIFFLYSTSDWPKKG